MKHFSRVVRVPETGSTNDDVAAMLGEDQARGLVLVAGYQTNGTGRRGRAWIAPPGSALLCTLAFPETQPAQHLWAVPFWAALVAKDALESLGCSCTLQWPNDVLIERRKIAGILCVSRVSGDEAWVGCGIGINVVRPRDETVFAEVESPPAFVSDVRATTIDAALDALLAAAENRYAALRDPERIAREWETAAQLPAQYRIVKDGEARPFDATAVGLAPDGSLIVERSGVQERVSLADARVLR